MVPGEEHEGVSVQRGLFRWLSAACGWKERSSLLFPEMNAGTLQPCGCCSLVGSVGVLFGSYFNKGY